MDVLLVMKCTAVVNQGLCAVYRSWVKLGAKCTFQTIKQNPGVSLSPKLDLPMTYQSPSPVSTPSSGCTHPVLSKLHAPVDARQPILLAYLWVG